MKLHHLLLALALVGISGVYASYGPEPMPAKKYKPLPPLPQQQKSTPKKQKRVSKPRPQKPLPPSPARRRAKRKRTPPPQRPLPTAPAQWQTPRPPAARPPAEWLPTTSKHGTAPVTTAYSDEEVFP